MSRSDHVAGILSITIAILTVFDDKTATVSDLDNGRGCAIMRRCETRPSRRLSTVC
jgi:hypothetical protein